MTRVITKLERELPNNELLGRQLFLKLTKLFPRISLDSELPHEEVNWSIYTIKIPKDLLNICYSPDSIKVEISEVDEENLYLTFSIADQDYNSSTLPLDTKLVYDNIRAAIKNDQV